MDFKHLIEVISRKRVIFCAVISVLIIISLICEFFVFPQEFRASAQVILSDNSSASRDWINVRSVLVKDPVVLNEVIRELDLRDSSGNLMRTSSISDSVQVKPVESANIIRITVSNRDPKISAYMANSIARQYVKWDSQVRKKQYDTVSKYLEDQLAKMGPTQEAMITPDTGGHILKSDLNNKTTGVDELWNYLVTAGYISESGLVTDRFKKLKNESELKLGPKNRKNRTLIFTAIKSGIFRKARSFVVNDALQRAADEMARLETERYKLDLSEVDLQSRLFSGSDTSGIDNMQRRKQTISDRLGQLNSKIKQMPEYERKILIESKDQRVRNNVYAMMVNRLNEMRTSNALMESGGNIIIYASVPRINPAPWTVSLMFLFILMDMMIATAVVFAWEYFDPSIKTPEDLKNVSRSLPVFVIPYVDIDKHGKKLPYLLANKTKDLQFLKVFNELYEFIKRSGPDLKVTAFTCPMPEFANSFIASNLGVAAAKLGKNVLIIDADILNPMQDKIFDAKVSYGLYDLMSEKSREEEVTYNTHIKGLQFMPPGEAINYPDHKIDPVLFKKVIDSLKGKYDEIIIDCPNVLGNEDAIIISDISDASLFVLQAGSTWSISAKKAFEMVFGSNSKTLCSIFIKGKFYL